MGSNPFTRIYEIILNKLPGSKKFNTDVCWNLVSFGVVGASGIVLNLSIAKFYGGEGLGVFNQVYAIFILFSQFAVAGIHHSVLTHIAQNQDSQVTINEIISTATLSCVFISLVVIFILFSLREFFGTILDSILISKSIIFILPGVLFFALNKIYLALHNGYRNMKAYAIFQALRVFSLTIFLGILIVESVEMHMISIIFSLSESFLFIILFVYSHKYIKIVLSKNSWFWIKKNLSFGMKATLGNIFIDINSRIDVLILGVFTSDRIVGIYSFAAIFADGFNQLAIVLRTNLNPILTKIHVREGKEALKEIVNAGKIIGYKIFIPLGIISVLLFPLMIYLLNLNANFNQSSLVFCILMVGSCLCAGYLPFKMILNQSGYPGFQTILNSSIFILNILLNLLLIPHFGMFGAAIATAIAFSSQIFTLKFLTYKAIGIQI